MKDKLYTIGQFAKLTDVKRQTLLWYDEIDLFKPYLVKENGYRYYSINQLDLFLVIRSFSSMGWPLKDIKDVITYRTPDSINTIFKEQEKKISNEITVLKNLEKSLAIYSNRIKKMEKKEIGHIYIEQQPETYLIQSQPFDDLSDESVVREIINLAKYRYQTKQFGNSLGGMVSYDNFIQDLTQYSYYYTETTKSDCNMIKPAGKYLVTYYRGHYTETFLKYSSLNQYAKKNNLVLGKYTYEQSQIDETLISDMNNYMTKISIPIIN